MKISGITDKEKQLLFIVLALGLLVCAYFFGFTKLMDQARAIEASNVQDQATVDQLQAMYDKQADTKAETDQFKNNIRNIVKKYPVDVPQEKSIYLLQQMEDIVGLHIDTINFSMDNMLMDFSGDDAPEGRYDALGVHFSASYSQFKDLLKYATEFDDRTTEPSISVEFDQSTGVLTGTVNYRMYYLTKTDSEFDTRTYEEVPPTGIESGVDSIFGALIEEEGEDGEMTYGKWNYNPIDELLDGLNGEAQE